jgi:general secretion pathway protein G
VLKKLSSQKGFTLLELLVVIVVIGILALLVIPNLTSAPKKARDIQRKTDMRAVQKALEEYYVSNSAYPSSATYCALAGATCAAATGPLTSGTPAILKSLPVDPLNTGNYVYAYTVSGTTAYTLRACLENQADAGQYTAADTTNCGTGGRSFSLVNNN